MSALPQTFEVTYLSTRSDLSTRQTTLTFGVKAPSDTVLTLDRSAGVSAFGAGAMGLEVERLLLTGQRTVRSAGVTVGASVLAVLAGFLLAMMWQSDRWPPVMVGAVVALVAGCGLLYARAKRSEPFRWAVPWSDVAKFTEMKFDRLLEWQVTVTGEHTGTLSFGVLGGRSAEFDAVLHHVHERGLAKVRFREREVPRAVVVGARDR